MIFVLGKKAFDLERKVCLKMKPILQLYADSYLHSRNKHVSFISNLVLSCKKATPLAFQKDNLYQRRGKAMNYVVVLCAIWGGREMCQIQFLSIATFLSAYDRIPSFPLFGIIPSWLSQKNLLIFQIQYPKICAFKRGFWSDDGHIWRKKMHFYRYYWKSF